MHPHPVGECIGDIVTKENIQFVPFVLSTKQTYLLMETFKDCASNGTGF